MGWVDDEFFWLWSPYFADVFTRRETVEDFEPSPEIIGCHEVIDA